MLVFAFIALIASGLSWTLVGAATGGVSRRGIDPTYMLLCGNILGLLISAVILMIGVARGADMFYTEAPLVYYLCHAGSGAVNYLLTFLAALAMARGPNNIVWGIWQSGTIFPFIMGGVFFGVPMPWSRILGMALMLTAVILFSVTRKSQNGAVVKGSRWVWIMLCLCCFVTCGMQQCLANLPSYNREAQLIHPVFRALLSSIGAMFPALLAVVLPVFMGRTRIKFAEFGKKWLWIYIFIQIVIGLLVSYLLTAPALDIMANNGCGSIAYPIMVVSCIVGFFLFSALILHEKTSWVQWVAFAACVVGIAIAAYIPEDKAQQPPETEAVQLQNNE
ncbi:MAG: hypothetical protein J6S21_00675 [Victivallales bacterium]|nr:hypothetical protein [Victivallales bacterium]